MMAAQPQEVLWRSGAPAWGHRAGRLPSVSSSPSAIASLHRGEKRLVFCDSRQLVEEIGAALRERGVSHVPVPRVLAARRAAPGAEQAFAEARDCVIVATSTLELGIDVGDLDRVIQVNDPPSVAAFLQRTGRTGRRPGSSRNCLFLALCTCPPPRAAGLLHLWGQGYVEPAAALPEPRHIVAQQLLAMCLQEHRIGSRLWVEAWNGLAPFDRSAEPHPAAPGRAGIHRPGRRFARPAAAPPPSRSSGIGTSWA